MESATTAASRPIRIFLVDDHRTMLWGLSRLIESASPPMQVVETACSTGELMEKLGGTVADLVLLDLDLGGQNSADLLPEIQKRTQARVLVLTGSRDQNAHENAIMRGARGVVCKDEPAEVILRAIERVCAGEVWINRALVGRVLSAISGAPGARHPDPDAERIATLTQRERQIVAAVVRNCGAKGMVIAEDLKISENTLRNHLSVIYEKLGVRNRLELFAFASSHRLGAP